MATRGFTGRRPASELADRIPPGQSLTEGFPVLSAGPTPRVSLGDWSFTLKVGPRPVKRWNWAEFQALPQTKMTRDIHCVTKWSKLNTAWTGVLIDDLLADAGLEPPTPFALAHSYDGYSTNVPLADLVGGKAMIATHYEGKPLTPEHGGPARLLVPHLYFWKSAVDQWAPVHRARRGGFLGAARVSHLWGSLARAALLGRLTVTDAVSQALHVPWQEAVIERIEPQTARVKSFFLCPQSWRPFRAGQHLDVRLTAPDGYQAQRSYSVASAPGLEGLYQLVVERLKDGEVSPFFHDVAG